MIDPCLANEAVHLYCLCWSCPSMHIIYYMSCVTYAHECLLHTCKQMMAAMERDDLDGCLTTNISSLFRESVFWQRAGRPRKYEGSWFYKRLYLVKLTLKKLRTIKNSYRLCSDNATVQHPIWRHECLCTILIIFLLKIWKLYYINYIINLNSFINNKQYQQIAPLKVQSLLFLTAMILKSKSYIFQYFTIFHNFKFPSSNKPNVQNTLSHMLHTCDFCESPT